MYSPLHCITNGAQLGVDSVNRTNACVPIPTKKIGNRQETRLCVLEIIMDVNGVITSAIENLRVMLVVDAPAAAGQQPVLVRANAARQCYLHRCATQNTVSIIWAVCSRLVICNDTLT